VTALPLGAAEQLPAWISTLGRLWGLRPAVLTPEELPACRAVLFEVYHLEMGWKPPPGNPSGLQALEHRGELVDDFDGRALWLGVYSEVELIACVRVIPPGPDGVEVSRYHPLSPALLQGAMEVNRLAIRRGHRGGGTFALVALLLRWAAQELRVPRALLAAEEPLARKLYRPLGWRYTGVSFRYHPSDRYPCELLALESGGAHLAASLARTVLRSAVGVLRGSSPLR
jgi:hypothetical protein